MSQWVAVAYDNKYYIGKVTAIERPAVLDGEDEISINYLARGQNGKYKWPKKKKDTDVVSAKYIFCTNPDVHTNEAEFTLENVDIVEKKYEEYRKSYMQ